MWVCLALLAEIDGELKIFGCKNLELDYLTFALQICTLKMSVPEYQDRGPLQITSSLNLDNLVGKSVIVTGG